VVDSMFMFLDSKQKVFNGLRVGTGSPQWLLLVSASRDCWR